MIDSNQPNSPPPAGAPRPPADSSGQAAGAPDLFSDLFAKPAQAQAPPTPAPARTESTPDQLMPAVNPPPCPVSLRASGLGLMQISDLVLKQLYLQGNLLGVELSRHARLPFQVVDEALHYLKEEKCIEVISGDLIGTASYRFNLTDLGRRRAKEAFEQCRYVGPAPVPLDQYIAQCRRQAITGITCNPEQLQRAFSDLIIRPDLLEEVGPAVCSGKSIFIYGPPGNGKTVIAKGLGRFLNLFGGDIYVPYAIHTEGNIITMFDPTIHTTTDDDEQLSNYSDPRAAMAQVSNPTLTASTPDPRWRRVRRPVVITGGELTLEMLDLRYSRVSNFYTAPMHIKANGGVFLIDDFGRQIVSPRDLLNRWILPLEERIDYLSLATGKKFSVPFEQLIIFSTNLDPRELVDEAFLRRIRHKIKIGPPTRGLFTEIFKLTCEQRNLEFTEEAIDFLYANFYDHGKPPRASDPRDLLEIAQAICRFKDQEVRVTPDMLAEATERFFCQV